MRHVGPVRRELAIPTVMNVVGPLANPAGARRQVVGVADAHRVPVLAGALAELDSLHALVVHGDPGLDEISPLGLTHVFEIQNGKTTEWTIDPADFGFKSTNPQELAGGDPAENARIVAEVLAGGGMPAAQAAVIMNAAAAIYVSGDGKSYGESVEIARAALSEGKGTAALERLRAAYSPPASSA
jgi:anthranilate phosphoribosyltransferase